MELEFMEGSTKVNGKKLPNMSAAQLRKYLLERIEFLEAQAESAELEHQKDMLEYKQLIQEYKDKL